MLSGPLRGPPNIPIYFPLHRDSQRAFFAFLKIQVYTL